MAWVRWLAWLSLPRPPRIGRPVAYALALFIPVTVAAFQHLVVPHLNIAPFVLLYFGVTLTSWLGGPGPGVVSALVSGPIGNFLFIPLSGNFNTDATSLLATILFGVTAAAIAVLTGSLRTEGRRKDEFLAVLSHELRNPLAPIRTSLTIIDRAPGSDQAKRALCIIDRQSAHMARLVDDLLDHARISSGKVRLRRERVELNALLRRVGEDCRVRFDVEGVALDVVTAADELWVDGDQTRLAQAIGNLLHNAVKFTPAGGRVVLATRRSDEDRRVVISVRDTGCGIAPELLRKIFLPFRQADLPLDRGKAGLGLGLPLARTLIKMHGGSLVARSEGAGQGAEFVINLPLVESRATGLAAGGTGVAERRRILLIEDNVDAAATLCDVLELNGHQVEVAHTGEDGLRKARSLVPDVILCDIGLPGMDGYAVARAVRADSTLRRALLVATTGYALPEDRRRALEAGFDLHMAKPLDAQSLQRTIVSRAA
jgi:signal transduction histidine kinase/CheY-like chemotaxis protein